MQAPSPRELLVAFVQLGFTGFGGPAAHVGLMEESLVRRRQWVTREAFLEAYATVQLLPGPTSTMLALVLGRQLGGWRGYWSAVAGFILPAVGLTYLLAAGWSAVGGDPLVSRVRDGLAAAVVGLLVVTAWRLGRGLLASPWQLAVAAAAFAASTVADVIPDRFSMAQAAGEALSAVVAPPPSSVSGVFLLFFFVGATLVGSGYALIGWLGALGSTWLGWLSAPDLLDAVAAGYLTPGPLFATATFAGMRILGTAGAISATVGIFLPALGYAALAAPLARWLDARAWRRTLRSGLAAACVGLVAAAVVPFARELTPWTSLVAALGLLVLGSGRVHPLAGFLAIAAVGALAAPSV